MDKFKSQTPIIQYIDISPVEARRIVRNGVWIPNNISKVDFLRRMMTQGEWLDIKNSTNRNYTSALIFTDQGILWEGKHRIWALSMCDDTVQPITFLCLLGWPTDKAGMVTPEGVVFNDDYGNGPKRKYRIRYIGLAIMKFLANNRQPTPLEAV